MKKVEELIKKTFQSKVKYRTIQEICSITRGRVMSKEYIKNNEGEYSVYSSQTENDGELGKISTYDFDGEYLTWTTDGANAGSVFYRNGKFSVTNVCGLLKVVSNEITTKFLYYILSKEAKKYVNSGMGNPKLMSNVMAKICIPVPPIEVQNEIVRILDDFTELEVELEAELEVELEARKKQYEYYRDEVFKFKNNKNVEYKKLGKVATISRGGNFQKKDFVSNGFPCIHYGQIYTKYGLYADKVTTFISESTAKKSKIAKPNDIIMAVTSENVEDVCKCVAWVGKENIAVSGHTAIIHSEINAKYLSYYFHTNMFYTQKLKYVHGTKVIEFTPKNLENIEIPIVSKEEQEKIVSILDKFDKLCKDISQGLTAEIEARRKQYEYYRDKLLNFKEKINE